MSKFDELRETDPPFIRFIQGNCPKPARFLPCQYVVDGDGRVGMTWRCYTTEECGHPEPYEHVYEVRLAQGGSKTYYEHELDACKITRVMADE